MGAGDTNSLDRGRNKDNHPVAAFISRPELVPERQTNLRAKCYING